MDIFSNNIHFSPFFIINLTAGRIPGKFSDRIRIFVSPNNHHKWQKKSSSLISVRKSPS